MLVAAQIPQHHLHAAMPMPMHDSSSKTRQWQTHAPSSPSASSSLSFSSYASTSSSSSSFSHSVVAKTLDEALDLEALALSAGSDYEDTCRSSYSSSSSSSSSSGSCGGAVPGSGLPLVCSNCGVSFFSLQITDDELECYCSGECKWSVIMCREMDRRMHALRRHVRAAAAMNTKARGAATARKSSAAVSVTRSSVATTTTTSSTASNESCPRFMDDVISCR